MARYLVAHSNWCFLSFITDKAANFSLNRYFTKESFQNRKQDMELMQRVASAARNHGLGQFMAPACHVLGVIGMRSVRPLEMDSFVTKGNL